jgi:hypothetical protein
MSRSHGGLKCVLYAVCINGSSVEKENRVVSQVEEVLMQAGQSEIEF